MLATRAGYALWLSEQQPARQAVQLGPWYATGVLKANSPEDSLFSQQAVDLEAKGADGKPLWTQRPGWKDGAVVTLSNQNAQSVAAYLFRRITAEKPVTLTVGLGGGDQVDLWFNGKKVLSKATSLAYDRYGTGLVLEGTRCDQAICDLPLSAGENHLLVRVLQDQVERRKPFQCYFSPSPNPVPRLWQQIRKDFPPSHNRLLEVVNQDWFEGGGWFSSADAKLEQRMIGRVLDETGPAETALRQELESLVREDVSANDSPWLDLCVKTAELQRALQDVEKLRPAIVELYRSFPHQYPGEKFLKRLDDYEKRLILKASERLDPQEEPSRRLIAELEDFKRQALVDANPLLNGAKLLFVKRYTYNSMHYYDDHYNGICRFGGNLCILSLDDGTVTEISPQLAGGIFDRYDLSFDARQIVFGYRRPKSEGFRIYEIGVDGSDLRQLTFPPADEDRRVAKYSMYSREALEENPLLYGHWTDDVHPCYLPDGRIVFASSRSERSVLCGGHSLTCTSLYRINADGGDLHQLSQGSLSEFSPTVLDDGRILYNRWEYVYKGIAAVQPLWVMRPDGSGSEEIYGNNIANPGVFIHGRQIPGRADLVVCTGVGHEPLAVGTILLLDLHKNKRTDQVMTHLTPDTDVKGLRGLYQRRNGKWRANDLYGPFYCDPYPLSDKFFLVVCNPDKRYNDQAAYGIYLLDAFGNRVLVYDDPEIACWQPTLLKPRVKPPKLPSIAASKPTQPAEATVLVTDIYRGLEGVKRGEVKYLRVMHQIPRPWSAWQHRPEDGIQGQMVAISLFTHIWVAILDGIVPVHEDGSAYFTVPADENVYFQALDENFMEIQRMRTFVNFQPGESRSCIGCHEHRNRSPVSRPVLALRYPPAEPAPQPGDVAPRPLCYASDVQPILDQHCVSCHGGDKPDGELDLTGQLTEHFNRSYESLLQKGLVNCIQEWTGPPVEKQASFFTVGGSMAYAEAVRPYMFGSHKSALISAVKEEHYDVRLPREDFIKLVTWVDANAPYYGSYFGRRNLRYKGHPDFRPVPTLASACGIPPEPQEPEPVAANLLAWWPLDEGNGEKTADASGAGYDGNVRGATWTNQGKIGNALQFQGTGYIELGDLGTFDTLSVAMWVKAGVLKNRWSPLLFCHGWEKQDLHFSLLTDGAVNVAFNGNTVVHRCSKTSVGDGRWHHVAAVLDSRYGGCVRFYIDGKLDQKMELGDAVPIVLDGFRIGAWNRWEGTPDNNFHGLLDDVRIYRGMLNSREIAELADGRPPAN